MKSTINLAQRTKTGSQKKHKYTVYIYGLFVAVIAVAMGVMVINIILKSEFSSLETTESQLLTQINNQADKKLKMLIISERYKNIKSLLASRGSLDQRLASLIRQFPSTVRVSGMNVKDNVIILTVESSNLLALNTILENDLPEYLKSNDIGVQLADVSSFKAAEGVYAAELRFEFAGGLNNE